MNSKIVVAKKGDKYIGRLLESIKKYTPQYEVKVIESDGYCIKSYLLANENKAMFMHDSMVVKDKDWLNRFISKENGGIVAHSLFPFQWDNDEQKKFIGMPDGKWGVFGPIFYTSCFNKLKPYLEKKIPSNVNEMRAWERGLGCVCELEGLALTSVYGQFDYGKVANNELEGLTKYFLLRD